MLLKLFCSACFTPFLILSWLYSRGVHLVAFGWFKCPSCSRCDVLLDNLNSWFLNKVNELRLLRLGFTWKLPTFNLCVYTSYAILLILFFTNTFFLTRASLTLSGTNPHQNSITFSKIFLKFPFFAKNEWNGAPMQLYLQQLHL